MEIIVVFLSVSNVSNNVNPEIIAQHLSYAIKLGEKYDALVHKFIFTLL